MLGVQNAEQASIDSSSRRRLKQALYLNNKNCAMKSMLLSVIVIALLLSSCDSPTPHWQPIISDALNQAIALEKLPDVGSVFSSDTIWIHPIKIKEETSVYDQLLADDLPIHIDKWRITPINKDEINKRSKTREFEYIEIYKEIKNDECIVNIIQETSFPPDSNLMQMDRGRLTLTFEYKNNFWKIKSLVIWFG